LGHHFGGLGSLLIGENGGDEHDGSEHNTKIEVGFVSLICLDAVSNDTEDCTSLKEEGEESSELVQEEAVPWHLLLLGKLIVSITGGEIFRTFERINLLSLDSLLGISFGNTIVFIGLHTFAEVLE
jgi:hypothetical protein